MPRPFASPLRAAPCSGLGLGVAFVLGACAPVETDREAWLRHTLVLDNQDLLEREPALTAGKFAKMSESPFAFLRGSAGQFARDVFEPGGAGLHRWAFVESGPDDVALVGDAHPENVGTFRRGSGELTVDFDDFDAATYGPFEFDVRRLALGLWIACEQARALLEDQAEDASVLRSCGAVTTAVPRGYADEVAAIAVDPTAAIIVREDAPPGVILADLLAEAREDGDAGKSLAEYTRIEDDARTPFVGDVAPARLVAEGPHAQLVYEDSVRAVDAPTLARLRRLIAASAATRVDDRLDAGAVLGATVRLGAGVSSYPLARWYVLVDGPTAAVDDDVLLEVKELRDAVVLPGARRPIDAPFDGNGPRVVGLQRELQGFVDDDPWLAFGDEGAVDFRIRERTGYQRGFAVDDLAPALAEGVWTPDDVVEFATICGRILARSHARARRSNGVIAGAAIAEAVADGTSLVETITAFVLDYGPTVLDDHARLVELLAMHGPTLGYR